MKHEIYLIVAVDKNFGIGKDGKLPWHFENEMRFFKNTTLKTEDSGKQNLLIMGRTTWESIPEKFRPLPGRKNAVLTGQVNYEAKGANTYQNLDEALHSADDLIEKIFIIGGAKVFNEALNLPNLKGIYLTKIDKEYSCDTFFPKIPEKFTSSSLTNDKENGTNIDYFLYR